MPFNKEILLTIHSKAQTQEKRKKGNSLQHIYSLLFKVTKKKKKTQTLNAW